MNLRKLKIGEIKKLKAGDGVILRDGTKATYKEYSRKTYAHIIVLADGSTKNIYSLYAETL